MPTFPSYDGPPLPEVLNPLDLRHYLMLADWIFFKPSRLKQYLYRADPDLYSQSGLSALAAALRRPAYWRLVLMALALTTVLSLVIPTAISWVALAAQDSQGQWVRVAFGVAAGVAASVAFGVAFGVAAGVAWGVVGGVVWGVALGVAGGVTLGVALGLVDLALRVAFGVTFSVTFGVAFGMALGVARGVAWGVAWGAVFGVVAGVALSVAFGIARGMEMGVALSVAFSVALSVATGAGALRSVFYAFQVWPALWQTLRSGSPSRRLARYPALTDELAVLPFPGAGGLLATTLAEDFDLGVRFSRHLLRNPFQRWVMAKGFCAFLMATPDPLSALYRALPAPLLNEYPIEPLVERAIRLWPSARMLWLGELADVFVDGTGGWSRGSERLAWAVTHPLRGRPHPRIAPLARFLLYLLDEERVVEKEPDEALLEGAAAVRDLPHGEEVTLSLSALAQLVMTRDLEAVAMGQENLAWLDNFAEEPIRPQVIEALRGLGDVSAEVGRFCQGTSPATRSAALNRAIGMLGELEAYVGEINLPERTLLTLTVQLWQSLVAEAAGRLGERALREMTPSAKRTLAGSERQAAFWSRPAEPLPNPYKAGDPVTLPLFVGREDVLNHVQEVWSSKENPDSIILYGHRRMGKSSILRNLGEYAPLGSLSVYVDLKGETALVQGSHHLLRGLADAVAWAAQERDLNLPEPDSVGYATPAEAGLSFRRYLRRTLTVLPEEASLILALDEFEAIDEGVRAGKIAQTIYNYLRSLSQEPRIVTVFAGLHTLDEMSRNYREAFFGSYVNIRVSYLSSEAAERLITRPTPQFSLDYDSEVVKRIVHETHGQPLLVQRICQELVNHVNHELFDLEQKREVRVLPEDLEAVLSDAFVRSETRYFDGIWTDQVAGRAAVEAVLAALAQARPATVEGLAGKANLPTAEVTGALAYLETRDLAAADEEGRWDLLVPLMRRWLRLRG